MTAKKIQQAAQVGQLIIAGIQAALTLMAAGATLVIMSREK